EGIALSLQVGKGLVAAVEEGRIESPETRTLLEEYLLPMKEKGVDQIVLGCTHYPFLQEIMQEIVGPGVQIIDPAPAVARRVEQVLHEKGLLSGQAVLADLFYSSGELTRFTQQLSELLKIQSAEILKTAFLSF
ncbi:MAG: aspartate/glutamate racemase family protein, partial [Bacteroidota bacterium]